MQKRRSVTLILVLTLAACASPPVALLPTATSAPMERSLPAPTPTLAPTSVPEPAPTPIPATTPTPAVPAAMRALRALAATLPLPPYEELVHLFDYDQRASLDIQEGFTNTAAGVTVQDLSYASPKGGRVPSSLVVPDGPGPFAGLILQHGLGPGDARQQMLGFATGLARTGAVVLLIDAPFNRPGRPLHTTILTFREQDREEHIQLIVDLRRGVDLLTARADVDPSRIAYSGISYGGTIGGLLAGVERRIRAYNLAVGDGGLVTHFTNTGRGAWPFRSLSREQQERWVRTMWPLESLHYVGHAAPAALFFQAALHDEWVAVEDARDYQEAGSEPKRVTWYDTGHELNEQAVYDLLAWLHDQIGIDAKKFNVER